MHDSNPNVIATSGDLEARIAAERQRLLSEQNLESELTMQRLAPLEAGDDEALDRVEQNLNACCDRQMRIQERIELLECRLEKARESEADAALDHLVRRAEQARKMGDDLIRGDYTKQAVALARTLTTLSTLDAVIADVNRQLAMADRERVANVGAFRSFPGHDITRTVRKLVGIDHVQHPGHGVGIAHRIDDGYALRDGRKVPLFVEADVVETECLPAQWRDSLSKGVRLPGAGPCDAEGRLPEIWSGNGDGHINTDTLTNLIGDIDARLNGTATRASRSGAGS